jgi:hypothetical protein
MERLSWRAETPAHRTSVYLIAIAWAYVVIMMTLAEGFSGVGSWLGAAVTFVLYGVLPLGIVLYLFATPARGRARRRAAAASATADGADPDGGGHPARDPVAPIREEA